MENNSIIGDIISAAAAIIAAIISGFVAYKIAKRQQDENKKTAEKNKKDPPKEFHSLKIYAQNSRAWANYILSHGYTIEHCTILIRNFLSVYETCSEEMYNKQLEEAISIWKELHQKGKIKNLRILKYEHLSDMFYGIFDDNHMHTSLNCFDANNTTTGQSSDNDAIILDKPEDEKVINKFINHFDSMVEYYKSNEIYNSDNA